MKRKPESPRPSGALTPEALSRAVWPPVLRQVEEYAPVLRATCKLWASFLVRGCLRTAVISPGRLAYEGHDRVVAWLMCDNPQLPAAVRLRICRGAAHGGHQGILALVRAGGFDPEHLDMALYAARGGHSEIVLREHNASTNDNATYHVENELALHHQCETILYCEEAGLDLGGALVMAASVADALMAFWLYLHLQNPVYGLQVGVMAAAEAGSYELANVLERLERATAQGRPRSAETLVGCLEGTGLSHYCPHVPALEQIVRRRPMCRRVDYLRGPVEDSDAPSVLSLEDATGHSWSSDDEPPDGEPPEDEQFDELPEDDQPDEPLGGEQPQGEQPRGEQ